MNILIRSLNIAIYHVGNFRFFQKYTWKGRTALSITINILKIGLNNNNNKKKNDNNN